MLGLCERPCDREPVDVRKLDVEQNDIWTQALGFRDGLRAVGRLGDAKARAFEHLSCEPAEGRVVVDDENERGAHARMVARPRLDFERAGPDSASGCVCTSIAGLHRRRRRPRLLTSARMNQTSTHQASARAWSRVGRTAGYLAGAGFLIGTVLYLLDATNALGTNDFHPSGAPPVQNEASYWVSQFAHQHQILWDVIARDTIFPVSFMALIVLALAARSVVPAGNPAAQLMTIFFVVGGVLATLADLIYLGATDYWRLTGWGQIPAVSMVAAGRSEQAIESLTRWPEAAGFVVLAAALVCLGALCRSEAALPSRLTPIVYTEAALLAGIAVAGIMQTGTTYDMLSLVTGALIGPAVTLSLGWHLGRTARIERTLTPAAAAS